MAASVQPESGGDTGRVRCLYCGANNFPSSAACWQCSRPLQALREIPSQNNPALASAPLPGFVAPNSASPARPSAADAMLAPKAAAALGLLFPLVGLPVGIVFLMLDDPRKTQLGWLLIVWSLAGTFINAVGLAVTLGPVLAALKGLVPHPGGGAAPALPSLPTDGGGDGLIFTVLSSLHA